MKKLIYLDNAATSFPKPPQVTEAMVHFMTEVGANPGRAGHTLAKKAEQIVQHARESIAQLFNIPDTQRIVFTMNVTESINTVLYGFLNDGDHVVTTAMEHNAVIRPLKHLEGKGTIDLSIVRHQPGLKRLRNHSGHTGRQKHHRGHSTPRRHRTDSRMLPHRYHQRRHRLSDIYRT